MKSRKPLTTFQSCSYKKVKTSSHKSKCTWSSIFSETMQPKPTKISSQPLNLRSQLSDETIKKYFMSLTSWSPQLSAWSVSSNLTKMTQNFLKTMSLLTHFWVRNFNSFPAKTKFLTRFQNWTFRKKTPTPL